MDVTVRTDRLLADFFQFLDQRIGLRNVLIVLTADHGVAPLPEVARHSNPGAMRLNPAVIASAAEGALRTRRGTGPAGGWVVYLTQPWIYLDRAALKQRGIPLEEAERVVRDTVKRVTGVNQAFT